MRRKIPVPNTSNGATAGYGHAGYGSPVGGVGNGAAGGAGAGGYSSHGGYGGAAGGAAGAGGGYGYGSSGGGGGGSSYSGYGSSTGGGFGVGMGEAYGGESSSYDSRSSLKGKKKRSGATSLPVSLALLMDKFVIAVVVALLLFGMTMHYRSQYKLILSKFHVQSIVEAVKSYERLEQDKKRFQREAMSGKETDRNLKNTIRELEKTNRELRKQQDELKVRYEASGGMGVEESEKLKAREGAWRKQVQLLQNATQRESKRAVIERYVANDVSSFVPSSSVAHSSQIPMLLLLAFLLICFPPPADSVRGLIMCSSRLRFPRILVISKRAPSKWNSHH